jgi:hypothetical protein
MMMVKNSLWHMYRFNKMTRKKYNLMRGNVLLLFGWFHHFDALNNECENESPTI